MHDKNSQVPGEIQGTNHFQSSELYRRAYMNYYDELLHSIKYLEIIGERQYT
jgi:hypothetical protein